MSETLDIGYNGELYFLKMKYNPAKSTTGRKLIRKSLEISPQRFKSIIKKYNGTTSAGRIYFNTEQDATNAKIEMEAYATMNKLKGAKNE
jgi:hypothetical protein